MAEGERLGSRLSAYRWHVPDPIAFKISLWAGIEHAGWTANEDGSVRSAFEERPDYFSSVAFWYQARKITALVLGWVEDLVVQSDSRGFGVAEASSKF